MKALLVVTEERQRISKILEVADLAYVECMFICLLTDDKK